MRLGTQNQQPGERQSYSLNYANALTAGDNVKTAAVLSVVPLGLVIDQVTVIDPRVKFWASSGTSGVNYKVTFRVATEDGHVYEDEVIIKVKEL